MKTNLGKYLNSIVITKEKIRQAIQEKGILIDKTTYFELYPNLIKEIQVGTSDINIGKIIQTNENNTITIAHINLNNGNIIITENTQTGNIYRIPIKPNKLYISSKDENNELQCEGIFTISQFLDNQINETYIKNNYIIKYNSNYLRWEIINTDNNQVIDYSIDTYETPQNSIWNIIQIQE